MARAHKSHRIAKDDHSPRHALLASVTSIALGTVLIAAKAFMYWHGHSASVLASLMDSISDVIVSVMSFFAIHFSLKPADTGHRYGHGKIEGLAALAQAAMIAIAGLLLVKESSSRFFHPVPITGHGMGIAVMLLAIALSIVIVRVQNYTLKRAPSLAVEADKAHYEMDILINAGVAVVLLVLYYGGPPWVDPVFALAVAAYLARTVWDIGRQGLDMLLDHELPLPVREHIIARVKSHAGVLGMHDLRTMRSGMNLFISFDIEVDPDLKLKDAHDITREIEALLIEDYPHAEIMIHVDPFGDPYDTRHRIPETSVRAC